MHKVFVHYAEISYWLEVRVPKLTYRLISRRLSSLVRKRQ